jgi:predicted amidohydrolase YtcJ
VAILEETSHSVWVNSKALEVAEIDDYTEDPPGSNIYKNPTTGEVDGILMDNAGDVILQMALAANNAIDNLHYDGLIEFGLPELAKNGITSICEAQTYWKRGYQDIWQELHDNNELTCRVVLNPWIYTDEDDATQIPILQSLYNTGDNMLKATQVKCYSDGIILNATAALHEPYIDNNGLPFNQGLNYIDGDRLANLMTILEQTGYDFHIHAIGDRGITESLDAVEAARNANGDIGARHRITHVEIVKESDYPRFAQLNVTADMQVASDFTNPENWEENLPFLGADRIDNIIPLKSIFETGARVTLSSDWDVSSLNPFIGMQNALTRAPQNLPTIEDAVKAYTINGAYVLRQETNTESLEVGKWADFICVNQDIFTVPTNQIAQTIVLST